MMREYWDPKFFTIILNLVKELSPSSSQAMEFFTEKWSRIGSRSDPSSLATIESLSSKFLTKIESVNGSIGEET